MTDWKKWHRGYDDPDSSLARRLCVVRRFVDAALLSHPATTPIRILSLCAGDGRDLLPLLARCERDTEHAVLVEWDATLAQRARVSAATLGVDRVTVLTGDAGDTASFASWLPVDLLLLCGIFGNVSKADISRTVAASSAMLRGGGRVIWTRGSTDPDLRDTIRRWFTDAGLREIAFESESHGFGVGVALKPQHRKTDPVSGRLFTFVR